MKHTCVLLIILAFTGAAAGQQPEQGVLSLSLKRAVQIAIAPDGNAQIQLSAEALKQANARSGQALAALLPDVSSSLSYRNQTLNLKANGLRLDIPTIPGYRVLIPLTCGPFQYHGCSS